MESLCCVSFSTKGSTKPPGRKSIFSGPLCILKDMEIKISGGRVAGWNASGDCTGGGWG